MQNYDDDMTKEIERDAKTTTDEAKERLTKQEIKLKQEQKLLETS
jgi:hypothetical protein